MEQFFADRPVIENKYHIQGQPFDPYKRMAYHGYDYDPETGLSDEELLEGLRGMAEELAQLPHPVAKAKAVSYVLEHTRIDVNAHDWFVGFYSLNRLASAVTADLWKEQLFDRMPEIRQRMEDMNQSGAVAIWPDFDHVVPDWDSLLGLGFGGIRARAEHYRALHQADGSLTPEMDAHFTAISMEYTAILKVLDRLYALACRQTHAKAAGIAACLDSLRQGPPRTLYEALQLIYIYFIVSECFDCYQVRSLGNGLDGTLYPFYQRELEKGTSREEIGELLAYFLLQWSAIGNYWGQPFYMGGTREDGTTKYNELSALILDVYDQIDIYNPKIQIKVNRNTPDSILFKVFDCIRRGHNCFVFCCEPGHIQAVMGYGASWEEALNMDLRGCYETGVRKNEVSTGTGYINALKPLQYVFTNGWEPNLGYRFGAETGALEALTTFDDFYTALLTQWKHLIEMTIHVANAYEPYLGEVSPSMLYSGTIEDSLRKGLDAYQNGVKFNNSALLNCGIASLTDSLLAVRYLVYEKKLVTLTQLKAALDADWVGYEGLRLQARRCPHKYGCGDPLADAYAAALAAFFAERVNGVPNARGGVYKAIMHSAMQFVWQGEKTPATPDGRRGGEEISKNASPSVGMDRNGVTALIRSALAMHPSSYRESFCLDCMLHPTAVKGDVGLQVMKTLLMTYLEGNGMSIQFNIFNTSTLRDAQQNPEKYRNLQVRVCGWNVLWNNLSQKEQDAYIRRAENIGNEA